MKKESAHWTPIFIKISDGDCADGSVFFEQKRYEFKYMSFNQYILLFIWDPISKKAVCISQRNFRPVGVEIIDCQDTDTFLNHLPTDLQFERI
jgi:hypothetical protein